MRLSEERKGQIALAFVKVFFMKKGFPSPADFPREFGNMCKDMGPHGVSREELESLFHHLMTDAIRQMFKADSVTLQVSRQGELVE